MQVEKKSDVLIDTCIMGGIDRWFDREIEMMMDGWMGGWMNG